ncbi:hypothetical protein Tco_0504970 [Tanacetum coccineum]
MDMYQSPPDSQGQIKGSTLKDCRRESYPEKRKKSKGEMRIKEDARRSIFIKQQFEGFSYQNSERIINGYGQVAKSSESIRILGGRHRH